MIGTNNGEPLHDLFTALDLLTVRPNSFGVVGQVKNRRIVQPESVPRYLISIISSSLLWLESDEVREAIWNAAAVRLSQHSGRTAMPSLSRVFNIPSSADEYFTLTMHEPSLTADHLGMKTWVSSYLLARRLHSLLECVMGHIPSTFALHNQRRASRILELGAGTGLAGLSFAALCGGYATVHLTDLPDIIPNLAHNVTLNKELLSKTHAVVTTGVLDWSMLPDSPLPENEKYDIILAADPLYSPEHPRWLVETVERWLYRDLNARVVAEMPLRDAYLPQVREFQRRMKDIGLVIIEEGEEIGYDDWEDIAGDSIEVPCWWSVWGWRERI